MSLNTLILYIIDIVPRSFLETIFRIIYVYEIRSYTCEFIVIL